MVSWALALDPGRDGAAVLGRWSTGGLEVARAWSWEGRTRKRGDVWILREWCGERLTTHELADLHVVGSWIRGVVMRPPYIGAGSQALVVEGLFGRGPTLERLSWYAGLVAGPVLCWSTVPVARPLASLWRREVLGIKGGTKADICEAKAVSWANEHAPGLGPLGDSGHVAEAACMAAWRAACST